MAYQITSRKFIDYQGRELSFPYASGFDPITAKYVMQGNFAIEFSSVQSVLITDNELVLLTGSWEDFGFITGAGITGTYGPHTIPGGTTITYIDGATMVVSASLNTDDDPYTSGSISCNDAPDALELLFNLVPNQNASENEYSLIDGEVNRFQVNLNSLGVGATIPFTRAGNFSGGSIMSATVKRLADSGTKRTYELAISYKLWTVKNSDLYLTTNCVKPWLKIRIMPEFNNPTVFSDIINSPSDANTGWLNERGNGNLPDYVKAGISWKNSLGVTLPGFDYSQASLFEANITGIFTAVSKFNICWFFDSIEDADYKNLPLSIENNLMFIVSDTPLAVGTSGSIPGSSREDGSQLVLSDIEITQTGSAAKIKGKFTPNEKFTAFFQANQAENRNYRLIIRCEDPGLSNNLVNPVWVNVDSGIAEKQIIPLGPYPLNIQRIYGHDDEFPKSPNLFIEDDIRINTLFKLPKGIRYNSIIVGIVAYNIATGENFKLESKEIDLSAYPLLPDGTSPVNYYALQDMNLSQTNPHKAVEMSRLPSLDDSDEYGIEINYCTLLNWRYWIPLPQASFDFFPNQNQNWFNYESSPWVVAFGMQIFTDEGTYENLLTVPFKNYDDFAGTSVFTYFRMDGTPLSKPLTNEQIRIVCTHTPAVGINVLDTCWSQITIEPFEGSPRWESSTLYPSTDPNNPLGPAQQTLTPTQVITECTYDPGKVSNPDKISFTSRFLSDNTLLDTPPNNRTKKTETAVKIFKPKVIEDRGNVSCCDCEFLVFASLTENDTYKNCISSRWQIGENVSFELRKNEVLTSWQPSTQSFANDTTAYYATITWKDVLISDGVGCYKLYAVFESAGIEGSELLGEFKLVKFSFPRLNNRVRIRSVFNDANDAEQINFTNSFVVDDVVINGDMNNFDPNTRIENWVYSGKEQNKSVRENETKYNLRCYMHSYCVIDRLIDLHFLGENQMYISDYAKKAFRPYILDWPTIVSESAKMKDYDAHDKKGFEIVLEKKLLDQYTHFGAVGASGPVNDPLEMVPNTVAVPDGTINYQIFHYGELIQSGSYEASGDLIINIE